MQKKLFDKLKAIDNFISEANIKLDYTKYLTPVNLREENSKFLNTYEKGVRYDPEYTYKPYEDINFDALKKQISIFELSNSPIEKIFKRYLTSLNNVVSLYQNRGKSPDFTHYSIEAYGFPNERLVEKAYALLNTNELDEGEIKVTKQYSALDLAEKLRSRISQYGFDWKIKVLDSSTTKVTVDPEDKVVYLNGSIKYSANDMERLKVHEVETHIVRSENGYSQPFKIFSTGLANSLATEEGLAVVSEEKNGVLDKNVLRLYAGRVIAVSLSISKSFYDIFSELSKFFSEQDALYITQRVKKGLCCTSECGGFTKDYAYFDGYYKIKEFLDNKNDPEILFVGSIGLEDILEIKYLLEANIINKPRVIPPAYRRRI